MIQNWSPRLLDIGPTRKKSLYYKIRPISSAAMKSLELRLSQSGESLGRNHMSIWTILFVILLIAWIGGFTMFHVASGLIHLLLVFAVISLILHFVLGRRTA